MLFNTFAFWLFFAVVTMAHSVVPKAWRKWLLLLSSYFFYMCWNAGYILVILAITALDYVAGMAIEQASGGKRRLLLGISMAGNFGLLFAFKYAAFAVGIFHLQSLFHAPRWILPMGLSFHTFQAVSYTFDVYRGRVRAERDFGTYALFVAFFPQMVAGPIERAANLIPQLRRVPEFDPERFRTGMTLALRGLLKKLVVADLAAVVVNSVYANPLAHSSSMLWVAAWLFSVQIYSDFSGYSDIAVGTARILGYDLTVNFRQPYLATSVAGFWRRWHISLSTWFRDYLYQPMGGNRQSSLRWCLSILTVFAASGLWHGANATFLVWGLLHAFYMIAGRGLQPFRAFICRSLGIGSASRLASAAGVISTNVLVSSAWVLFRAPTLTTAIEILKRMMHPANFGVGEFFGSGLPRFEMALLAAAIPVALVAEWLFDNPPAILRRAWGRRVFRWPVYAAGVYVLIFFGVFSRTEFIYFQF